MNDLQHTCFQEHNIENLSFENVKEISDEILTWFWNNDPVLKAIKKIKIPNINYLKRRNCRARLTLKRLDCSIISGMILQQWLEWLFNSRWHDCSTVIGTIVEQSLTGLFNNHCHDCSTVTTTIVQQSLSSGKWSDPGHFFKVSR